MEISTIVESLKTSNNLLKEQLGEIQHMKLQLAVSIEEVSEVIQFVTKKIRQKAIKPNDFYSEIADCIIMAISLELIRPGTFNLPTKVLSNDSRSYHRSLTHLIDLLKDLNEILARLSRENTPDAFNWCKILLRDYECSFSLFTEAAYLLLAEAKVSIERCFDPEFLFRKILNYKTNRFAVRVRYQVEKIA